jgi:hypothetical protein
VADILDEVIQQLGGDLLEELVAWMAMIEVLADEPAPEDFPLHGE